MFKRSLGQRTLRGMACLWLMGAFAAAVSVAPAAASATSETVTFTGFGRLCNGDELRITATLHYTAVETATPSGGTLLFLHQNLSDAVGVDTTTGTIYRSQGNPGVGLVERVTTPSGVVMDRLMYRDRWQPEGGAGDPYSFTWRVLVVLAPDGTARATLLDIRSTC